MISSPDQVETDEKIEQNERALIDANWQRYEYGRQRGHRTYCRQAKKCERFYLGGGEQWSPEDRAILESAKRPVTEINMIMPAINAAVGYHINNRLEFTFVPRGGGAGTAGAEIISKVSKQIMDNNGYRYLETDAFEDGLIQQRGYLVVRVRFNDSLLAEAEIYTLDTLDVIPDPDAKTYDTSSWKDVTTSYWLTLDEIEQQYGTEKRMAVENTRPRDGDHGDENDDESRNKFGDENAGGAYDAWISGDSADLSRVRVIEREVWRYVDALCGIWPTGDVRVIEGWAPERIAKLAELGVQMVRRKAQRVFFIVTTSDVLLHNDYSPYSGISIVPFFPYFRRGKTRGLVDNAISPQETFNKATSSFLHITNSVANSGWVYEEDSVTNLSAEQIKEQGATTGLVMSVAKNTPKDKWPTKILPNPIPAGIDRVIEHSRTNIQSVTIPDAMLGSDEGDMSGVAIQTRQFAAQMRLARPLDNLARTRRMVAFRLLDIIQKFYDDTRVLRIRQTDKKTGKDYDEELVINELDEVGNVLTDLTIGEYDVVIAEVPVSVTFDNGQFQQALEMKKEGVAIPDAYVVKYSNLSDKADIIESMEASAQNTDPEAAAKAELMKAQAEKTRAETVVKNVEAIFSATEAAQNIAAVPQVAPLGDDILGSAGYIDLDGPPLIPPVLFEMAAIGSGIPEPDRNTNPMTPINPEMPASPVEGVGAGIEGGAS